MPAIRFAAVLACLVAVASLAMPSPAADSQPARPVKVFLLAGQSNMVGGGLAEQTAAPYNQPFDKVRIWNGADWAPLTTADSAGKGAFGPELAFGHAVAKLLPDDRILLIKHAEGGTNLYRGWAPTDGPQYAAFMRTARAALKNLDDAGVKYEIAAMLWLQGESDAHENKGDLYEQNLTAFIAHMRDQFKTPDMPFLIARVLGYYGGESGHAKLVRDAQVKIADADPRAAWFDTDDLTKRDPGHYDSAGLIHIGNRFAETWTKLVGEPK